MVKFKDDAGRLRLLCLYRYLYNTDNLMVVTNIVSVVKISVLLVCCCSLLV